MLAVGLFAGIGGIELGLKQAGIDVRLLCEVDSGARRILESRFGDVPLEADVAGLAELPPVEVLTAGFPCQDLSQCGKKAGIDGIRSGLVSHVFRLIDSCHAAPRWALFENVPFMLRLDGGKAMSVLTRQLEARGYRWAYRVLDSGSFGLPQRRRRVWLLASTDGDPRAVLLAHDDGHRPEPENRGRHACGFYFTEGKRSLCWAVDAVPPLKTGSPPGIWLPQRAVGHRIAKPSIEAAERLQGFPSGWTDAGGISASTRRRYVGNSVSVPVSAWIGRRLLDHGGFSRGSIRLADGDRWPDCAWGENGTAWRVDCTAWPQLSVRQHLAAVVGSDVAPLSLRATEGFTARLTASGLRHDPEFRRALAEHINWMRSQ